MDQNQINCYVAPEWLTCLIQTVIGLLIVTFTCDAGNFTNLFDVNGEALITVIADLIVKSLLISGERPENKQNDIEIEGERRNGCAAVGTAGGRGEQRSKEEPLVLGSRHK